MDAITMPSTNSLISRLKRDFPEFRFEPSETFHWSASNQTVFFGVQTQHSDAFSLHEVSHAILGHHAYRRDIDLIKLERDAWDYAKHTLAARYIITIDEDTVQDNLDTYRDWLHARSVCPYCQATGLQTGSRQYKCLACDQEWRVNEARLCGLKRYTSE